MTRVVISLAAALLAGCATHVEVFGPCANHVSHADIREITALIDEQPFRNHSSTTLEAVSPNKVRVSFMGFGRSLPGGGVSGVGSTYFIAVRRNGMWTKADHFDKSDLEDLTKR